MKEESLTEELPDENKDVSLDDPSLAEIYGVINRVDERTEQTNRILGRLIEERIRPLERRQDRIDTRSKVNRIVLSALGTVLLAVGTWALDLIPF